MRIPVHRRATRGAGNGGRRPAAGHRGFFEPLLLCSLLGTVSCLPATASRAPAVEAPADHAGTIESVEAWAYDGHPGRIIRTEHYRIYTTQDDPTLMSRLPAFVETALAQYRTALGPLPAPALKMDTFVMATRPQWARLTQQLMGDKADLYLRIPRGGYASGGRAVFFDLGGGGQDTMSMAAHEGWHQYTQRTFRNTLPAWLEEGIATFMEGHRWDRATPVFLGWANLERFDQLRGAAAAGHILSLGDLLATSPQRIISGNEVQPENALTYYAQVWVLTHFLREGAGGRYRKSLEVLVSDAQAGRLAMSLSVRTGRTDAGRALGTGTGPVLFAAYFNRDLNEAAGEYARFIEQVVRPGSRGPIVEGRSPIPRSPGSSSQ